MLGLKRLGQFVLFVIAFCGSALTQVAREFHQSVSVSIAQPVSLDIELPEGDLQVAYRREGEVLISLQITADSNVRADFSTNLLSVTRAGNQINIRQHSFDITPDRIRISYRIDVPYRTEVHSFVNSGKQTITGIMGPVSANANNGDLNISYVSKAVVAHAGTGNLDLQVIGDHVEASTGRGNISCSRAAQGVSAETGNGDISLMVVGPSQAEVKQGGGRIDAGGIRGTLVASTDAGAMHVKAVPRDDWRLSSVSGTIRLELPPVANFDLDAMTASGDFTIMRDDLQKPDAGARRFSQRANGGGKRIEIRTESGRIVVS
jgi:DUF4097 and DUF4098 domain-containing protein YvlB